MHGKLRSLMCGASDGMVGYHAAGALPALWESPAPHIEGETAAISLDDALDMGPGIGEDKWHIG